MPSTRLPIATAESTEPIVSNRPRRLSRELPTTRSVRTNETPANRTGIANSHGHVK